MPLRSPACPWCQRQVGRAAGAVEGRRDEGERRGAGTGDGEDLRIAGRADVDRAEAVADGRARDLEQARVAGVGDSEAALASDGYAARRVEQSLVGCAGN